MIARLTRILLLLQVLVAGLIGYAVSRHMPSAPVWLATGCGIGFVFCIRALIAANNFRLARSFGDEVPVPRLGWRRAARMYLRELAATLISSSWNMPFRGIGAAPTIFPNSLPVLLIHGYGCNSGYWRCLCRHLRQARISFQAVDLEPPLADIDSYVPQISAAIASLCTASGQSRVIIVGHSMGGLVARAWLRANGSDRIARLITLGTPHGGTGLARFGVGENSRQMRRTGRTPHSICSPWLTALKASGSTGETLLVSIYSRHDNIVAPPASAVVANARNIAFDGIGHVALASDPAVIACVLAEIGDARWMDADARTPPLHSGDDAQGAMSTHSKPSC